MVTIDSSPKSPSATYLVIVLSSSTRWPDTTYSLATIHVLQVMTDRQTTDRQHIVPKTLDLKHSAEIVDLGLYI